ncbi:MAG: ABC transporter permease [Bacteroidales bacterium]|nr:ABC transporter permease [Bacteroidales bacterium]MDD4822931.1 ABC transporter permease [Bacteroidales bacterium]
MNSLTRKNRYYYRRYYKLIAIASLITVAVIIGSMVVGDSVRMTLVRQVEERLGTTETVIFSRNSFISENILKSPLLETSARGILLTNGFVSQGQKLIPVFVWGVDDGSVAKDSVKMNPALAAEMKQEDLTDIVLRLPASGLVPSGSLFVTENYTSSLRLAYSGIVPVKEGGNISMKNEQIIPFNIFVNRQDLATVLEVKGKINLILVDKPVSAAELSKVWDYTSSGLKVSKKNGVTEITSDRIFLQQEVIQTIAQTNSEPNRLFSYLANSIEKENTSIPYSFVVAMDRYKGVTLKKDEILLSDYSARRLHASIGDTIQITYFKSQQLKMLTSDTVRLRVGQIVPLSELQQDSTMSANFPGLSNVERCTDWDSDLPIQMDLITDEDENYWDLYRTTPKAIIAYEAVAGDWSTAYGSATAIRLDNPTPDLSQLRSEMFGIQLLYPREAGLFAAKNGVDFSSLFLSLAFFIIVSAILLMLIPVSGMLYQRQQEIDLLKALGYSRKRIVSMLWSELSPVVLAASVIGVLVGLVYTGLVIWLLGNVWIGATQTDNLSVYPSLSTVLIGLLAGIIISLSVLRLTIVRSLKEKQSISRRKKSGYQTRKWLVILSGMMVIGLLTANILLLNSVAIFVTTGVALIGAAALWGDYLIVRNASVSKEKFDASKLIWATLYANKKQALLSFLALATGVFIVFSVGLNRKGFADSSQLRTGTGGYTLWCESTVPIYHSLATAEGREKLSLKELPADTKILQCLRYGADDASCLNLNKVTTSTVLGVDMNELSGSDFQIEQSIYPTERKAFFDRMQSRNDSVYPALVDATVLTWGLGLTLGDTLYYERDNGQRVAIQLVGTISNSIFQGNILIDRTLFGEIWKETTGSEVFLLKTDEQHKEEIKTLLSQALSEYGVRVSTTNDRLKQFNTVTDTYLTIFLTLGGLGLLLGIMSFIIVIRKNLSMRRREIEMYRILGFTDHKTEQLLYKENLIVPVVAIATGVISALIGVMSSFMNAGIWIWLLALLFTILFVGCVQIFVRKSVKQEVENSKLLPR